MWKRILGYAAPVVVFALLIACDGVPWATSNAGFDPDVTQEAPSSSTSTDDSVGDLIDQSDLVTSDDCCLIADPLDPNPRAGCGDPAIEACVCTHRPSCCQDIWSYECVIDTLAACGICTVVDPYVITVLSIDSDNDGRNDFDELIEGTDPKDPTDGPDIDGDGIPNGEDPDVDGDGIPNGFDLDVDGDGMLNVWDIDIDGDGIVNFLDLDDDGDGLLDEYDIDSNADGIPDRQCFTDDDCDDGNVCNGAEVCTLGGICRPGPPPNCSDHVACTVDGCDPSMGCFHTTDDTACNDGVDCTADTCDDMLGCMHEADDNACNDNIDCTADSCNAMLGCVHAANHAECDDAVDCTEDSCDSTIGCRNVPRDDRCPNEGCLDQRKCDDSEGCGGGEQNDDLCEQKECKKVECRSDGECVYENLGDCTSDND